MLWGEFVSGLVNPYSIICNIHSQFSTAIQKPQLYTPRLLRDEILMKK